MILARRRRSCRTQPAGLLLSVTLAFAPRALGGPSEPEIYFSNYGTDVVSRIQGDGAALSTLVTGLNIPLGVAMDSRSQKLYWADNGGAMPGLFESNLDGTGMRLVAASAAGANGLALDPLGDKLYWTTADDVMRCNIDGSGVETVYNGSTFIDDVALDLINNQFYFTNPGSTGRRIYRANLDGSGLQTVLTGLGYPSAVAVDPSAGMVYWVEYQLHRLQRANLDGTGIQTIYQASGSLMDDMTIDVAGGKIYWNESGRLRRADLNGSNVQTVYTGPPTIGGIALAVPEPAALLIWGVAIGALIRRSPRPTLSAGHPMPSTLARTCCP